MDSTLIAIIALAVGALLGGTVTGLVVLAVRLRDRARQESSRDLPDGTRAVLLGMEDVAVVVDGSLCIVAASPPAEMFGMHEGDDLSGDGLRSLARSARRSDRAEATTLTLRRGIEPRLVVARAGAITPTLMLVIIRDITERERVEQMRRDFVTNTSHELKTPVSAITLLAEAVETAADDPQQVRHFAGRLGAEATRLSQLTSRIMNLSRLQAADDLSEMRDVSIDEVVAAAIESQAVAAEAAQITVQRGGDRQAYVRGDVQVLIEVVANLLSNAIAYSPAGASVGVGVRRTADLVEIAVSDRGIGMSEEEQRRIFERFYRADAARSRRTGGTGLGLSIVKYAVQRHGGEVELWSRVGRGSTFTVRLPAIDPPADLDPFHAKKTKKAKKAKKVKKATRAKDAETSTPSTKATAVDAATASPAAAAELPHPPGDPR